MRELYAGITQSICARAPLCTQIMYLVLCVSLCVYVMCLESAWNYFHCRDMRALLRSRITRRRSTEVNIIICKVANAPNNRPSSSLGAHWEVRSAPHMINACLLCVRLCFDLIMFDTSNFTRAKIKRNYCSALVNDIFCSICVYSYMCLCVSEEAYAHCQNRVWVDGLCCARQTVKRPCQAGLSSVFILIITSLNLWYMYCVRAYAYTALFTIILGSIQFNKWITQVPSLQIP